MPDFDKLAEKAINDQWKGARLERALFVFERFEQPLPVDLEIYVSITTIEEQEQINECQESETGPQAYSFDPEDI